VAVEKGEEFFSRGITPGKNATCFPDLIWNARLLHGPFAQGQALAQRRSLMLYSRVDRGGEMPRDFLFNCSKSKTYGLYAPF